MSPAAVRRPPAATDQRIFLLTGGTGFLGSHLAVRLLADGHRVRLLARGSRQVSALRRVQLLLDWFGLDNDQRTRLEVLQGHLDDPCLGLEARDLSRLKDGLEETVHCASETSFAARHREQVERTNIRGLEHLLGVLQHSRCRSLHLVSTAYAAGKTKGTCREVLEQPAAFHNAYEESKCKAEHLAARRCARNSIRLHVYRPSIVYGDAESGRTLLFNALYYPIRTMHYFQKLYIRDILENGGSRARALDICLDPDGALHLPLRLNCSETRGVNLIPVDHFVRAFMAIREEADHGGVFHIVNRENTPLQRIVEYSQRFFQVSGIRTADQAEFETRPRNGLELLFEKHIQVYGSYMRDTRVFDQSRTAPILAGRNIVCPDFSYEIYARCMRYAIEVDWGRRLALEK